MKEEMWIIQGGEYGLRDVDTPMLWFSVSCEGHGAMLSFHQPKADQVIRDFGVTSVKHLNGKPVIVSVDGNVIEYVRPAKIG